MTAARRALVCALAASLVAAACSGNGDSSPFGGDGSAPTSAPAPTTAAPPGTGSSTTTQPSGGGESATTTTGAEITTTTTQPADAGPPRPLPLMEGLATFDTYEWTMSLITVGPTAEEYNDISMTLVADRDGDMRRTTVTSTQDGPDFDGPETTTQDMWQDATGSCSYDGSDYGFQEITAQQREIIDVALGLFDLQVIPEAGTEIGSEPVAGVAATHYRYTISGLGRESGAVVTENQVDYWLADDTGALVKYSLVAETRSGPTTDPTAEVFRVEASAELRAANGPVDAGFPPECQALRPEPSAGGGQATEPGSRIVVRYLGEAAGVLAAEPECSLDGGVLSALVDGRIDGTRFRVAVAVRDVSASGTYDAGSFALLVGATDEPTSTGDAPVTVSFLEGGLVTLDFDAIIDGAVGKDRLRGSLTCAVG